MKAIVHKIFGLFGLRISRLLRNSTGSHYFNTGNLTPIEENTRELYDRFYGDDDELARYYADKLRIAFYHDVSKLIRRKKINLDGKRILDIGCGTGHLLQELAASAYPVSISGCDFSEEAMSYSRTHFPGINFFQHNIYDQIPENFDVIVCTEVLEHLEYPHQAIANILAALVPGGVAVVTVPNGRRDTVLEHINFWSPESWKIFIRRECPGCDIETATLDNDVHNYAIISKPSTET